MAVKAIAPDDAHTQHFIIGLNRGDVESILRGDVITLPRRIMPELSEDSDIVVLFADDGRVLGGEVSSRASPGVVMRYSTKSPHSNKA